MKDINIYIIEKFKLNSNNLENNSVIRGLCKMFNAKTEEVKFLSKYYTFEKDEQNEIYNSKFNDVVASPLETLLMIAFMLVDDGFEEKDYDNLGYKGYSGKNNPYDWSWFEEEDKNGKDLLELCQKWINNNEDEFKKIFNFAKKHYKDFKKFAKDEEDSSDVIDFFFNYFYNYL